MAVLPCIKDEGSVQLPPGVPVPGQGDGDSLLGGGEGRWARSWAHPWPGEQHEGAAPPNSS